MTMVLAGGEGKRLRPLTLDRAKPAVPFGGRYRLIDFVLSNLINSGLLKIKVLTQYKSDSLIQHLSRSWNLPAILGYYIDVVPAQMRTGREWFKGSADAIFQNIHLIENEKPDMVAIFGADHIYRMDIRQMLDFHMDNRAELTVATISVPASQSSEFGNLKADDAGRVIHYEEKPKQASPGQDGMVRASMGNFIFNTDVLLEELELDAMTDSTHDIAGDIVAGSISKRRVFAYDFKSNYVPGTSEQEMGYWKDVGTLDSYYCANMDLVSVSPVFSLYNSYWPIRSYHYQCPPAKFVFSDIKGGRVGVAYDSLVCEGAIISGGTVRSSIVSPLVRINSYSLVEESVLLEGVTIGRHCRIKKAIIDKNVNIPAGTVIGHSIAEDRARFHVSPDGVVIIPRGYLFPGKRA